MKYGIYNYTLKRWVKEYAGGKYIDIVRDTDNIMREFLKIDKERESLSQHMYDDLRIKEYKENL
jgi:hypothetical protein